MAYVRVVIDIFRPGTTEEALARVREGLVPLLQQQPGFLSYEVVSTGEDTAIFINAWETREQAEAATRAVVSWSDENMADLIVAVERYAGELVFSRRA